MRDLLRDARFGLRLLRGSPVFTAVAALLLGIGISANTLIFSVVDALLLRQLPVTRPEELVRIVEVHSTGFETWELLHGQCAELARRSTMLRDVICQAGIDAALTEPSSTERVRVHAVPAHFFSSLGAGARLGRVIGPGDDRAATPPAVLSYGFWQRRYQGDPSTVGRTVVLHGHPFQVVGVTPREFNGFAADTSPDLRVPLECDRLLLDAGDVRDENGYGYGGRAPVEVYARLRPGVSLAAAQSETEAQLVAAYDALLTSPKITPDRRKALLDTNYRVQPIANGVSTLRNQFARGLTLLMAGVGLLLALACINVAGLVLARAAAREQELAIRLAIGATPWRIARQVLTESLLLAIAGGAIGLCLAYAAKPLLVAALPPIRDRAAVLQPLAVRVDIDTRVLAFSLAITAAATLLFGLWPAIGARRVVSARGFSGGRRVRNLVLVAQVGLCTLLLCGSALLLENLGRMRSMDAGFERDRIVTFTIDPGLRGYPLEKARLLSKQLLDRTRELPGVAAASLAGRGLMRGTGVKATMAPAGQRAAASEFLNTSLNSITPGYFETMGMRVTRGRDFTWSEPVGRKPAPVIVNEAFVRRFYPGQDPLGKRFGNASPHAAAEPANEIVGVVNDARYRSLREPIQPITYSSATQGFDRTFILHVRTGARPEDLAGPVREVLRQLDPDLPIIEARTLHSEIEDSMWQERLLASLSALFGVIAALVAAIGLYGTVDFAVRSRYREIGIRMALGAGASRILTLLSTEILLLTGGGIALGLLGSAAAAPWLRSVLYQVEPADPGAIAAAVAFFAAVAAVALAPPYWRALQTDPATALRHE